ncbi:MAG: nucleoside monophosphate kinase [Acidobacteriota bacterium]
MPPAAPPGPWPALVLVGPTGAGKTPLGDELERRGFRGRRCAHFDFGARLRALADQPDGESGLTSREAAAVRDSLATGALFEDRDLPMIVRILRRFAAERLRAPGDLLVLNGLPRHPGQAEALAGLVAVELVVSLEADAAVIRERLRLDPGRDRAGRTDDGLGAVSRRLEIFHERTAPLIAFYRGRGVPALTIAVAASTSAAEMHRALAAGAP